MSLTEQMCERCWAPVAWPEHAPWCQDPDGTRVPALVAIGKLGEYALTDDCNFDVLTCALDSLAAEIQSDLTSEVVIEPKMSF